MMTAAMLVASAGGRWLGRRCCGSMHVAATVVSDERVSGLSQALLQHALQQCDLRSGVWRA
jgi:hypothetical protein